MKLKISILTGIMLLVLAANTFAQSNEARTRALQGSWVVTNVQDTSNSGANMIGDTWTFDGYKCIIKNSDNRKNFLSFLVIDNNILIIMGYTLHYTYTLQGNILTMSTYGMDFRTDDEITVIITLRKI